MGIRRIFRLERNSSALDVGHAGVRQIVDTAHEGIWLFDANGRTTFVNRRMAEMLGAKPEELIGARLAEFLDPEDRESAERDLSAWLNGSAQQQYRYLHRRDGTDLWAHISASSIQNQYRSIVGLLGMFTDITDRRQLEQALQRAETEFRIVFDSSAVGIVVVNPQGFAVMANTALLNLLGYRREEISEISFVKATHPDDIDEDRRMYQALMRGEFDSYRREKRYVHRNGNVVWAHVNVSLVRSSAGEPQYAISIVEDVTEKHKAELALRDSEGQLRRALDAARMGIWEWDIDQDHIEWSANVHRIFGLPPDQTPVTRDASIAIIAPQDRERVSREIGAVLATVTQNNYITEYQVAVAGGGIRWFEVRGEVERNDAGRPFHMAGTIVDVTDRKNAEIASRQAAQLLRQSQERELRVREEFSRHLLNAQEQERQRLANELHDGLGQNLSLIKNRMHLALEIPNLPPALVDHLKAVTQIATDAIAEVRSLAQNLRPIQIEQLGLTASLRSLIEQVRDSTSTQIEGRLEDVDDVLRADAATHLYRIVQEALNNVLKHARAPHASVILQRDVRMLRLEIRDDGAGFDTGSGARGGLGLTSMGERAQMLGGSLAMESVPGKGTRVQVSLPFTEPAEREQDRPS